MMAGFPRFLRDTLVIAGKLLTAQEPMFRALVADGVSSPVLVYNRCQALPIRRAVCDRPRWPRNYQKSGAPFLAIRIRNGGISNFDLFTAFPSIYPKIAAVLSTSYGTSFGR